MPLGLAGLEVKDATDHCICLSARLQQNLSLAWSRQISPATRTASCCAQGRLALVQSSTSVMSLLIGCQLEMLELVVGENLP